MLAVKNALRAKAVADATLIGVALLNGSHVYQSAPEIDSAPLDQWITFSRVTTSTDQETGYSSELYQFDVWARSSDRADQIAERLSIVLGWRHGVAGSGTLTIVGRRLAQPVSEELVPSDASEAAETGNLHQRIRQFRVATYAT
jgi:hypothetical protein